MKKKLLSLAIIISVAFSAYSQSKLTPDSVMAMVAKGKTYTLVFLRPVKNVPKKNESARQLQIDHLTHLFTMEQQGKYPFLDL